MPEVITKPLELLSQKLWIQTRRKRCKPRVCHLFPLILVLLQRCDLRPVGPYSAL